jgi:hypothetical protein|eukprot:COSAG02_NODE_2999_length_7580_cov_2.111482_4_plen_149_part_00
MVWHSHGRKNGATLLPAQRISVTYYPDMHRDHVWPPLWHRPYFDEVFAQALMPSDLTIWLFSALSGTGMRASVLVALPKLAASGGVKGVEAVAEPLGLAVRGLVRHSCPLLLFQLSLFPCCTTLHPATSLWRITNPFGSIGRGAHRYR